MGYRLYVDNECFGELYGYCNFHEFLKLKSVNFLYNNKVKDSDYWEIEGYEEMNYIFNAAYLGQEVNVNKVFFNEFIKLYIEDYCEVYEANDNERKDIYEWMMESVEIINKRYHDNEVIKMEWF